MSYYTEPNDPQSIHCRCKLICTCLWLNVNNSERELLHVTDTQIGLLGEKYSLALIEISAFKAYDSAITNLIMLYLTNANSHDFGIRQVELVRRENSVPSSKQYILKGLTRAGLFWGCIDSANFICHLLFMFYIFFPLYMHINA